MPIRTIVWLMLGFVMMVNSLQAQQRIAVPLDQLPVPPQELQELIEAGHVKLRTGIRDPSRVPAPDPNVVGETRYLIQYSYTSRAKWKLQRARPGESGQSVLISIRFQRIVWTPTHTIWLQSVPPTEGFWSDSILLHEFDHVRISNDPRLGKRFEQRVRELTSFRHKLKPGEVINRKTVDGWVDRRVQKVFDEITDLIAIHYQELDRVTEHGLRPLPADSPLQKLLRGDSPASK